MSVRTRLNLRLVLGTVAVLGVLSVLGYLVHGWQVGRLAAGQLALADEAEQEGRAETALQALKRYLLFAPGDHETRVRHALLLAKNAGHARAQAAALELHRRLLARDAKNVT